MPSQDTDTSSEPGLVQDWLYAVFRFTAANVLESRICQVVLELFPRRFIRSLEGAPVDGALFLEDCLDPTDQSLERHRSLEGGTNAARFVPVEIKSCLPYVDSPPGNMRWSTAIWKEAELQGIIIIGSPLEPDRVAVCPAPALLQHIKETADDRRQAPIRLDSERQASRFHVPGFPSNIQPYVVPISALRETLQNVMDSARDASRIWRNPVTRVDFAPWRPQVFDKRNLNLISHRDTSEQILRLLHTQFSRYSSRYQVRVNALSPTLGDFHFFKREGGQRYFIEIKSGLLHVSRDEVTHHTTFMERPLFTWREVRDFLLSFPDTPSQPVALLVPWSDLPSAWRESSYNVAGREPLARAGSPAIEQYLIRWLDESGRDDRFWSGFCQEVEDRLDHWQTVPLASGDDYLRTLPRAHLKHAVDEGDADTGKVVPSTSCDYQSQPDFACKAASALRKLLVRSGKLTLHDVGPRCKISRYWVCRRHLPPSDPTDEESISPDFSLLSLNALLIPVQFIRIELLDDLGKHCGPPYDLEGWGPGLLIFESRNPADLDASHCRWVADSRAFPARFPEHTPIEPNLPLLWADCETTEEDDGERNIVQRILRAFLPDGERQAPIVLASTVLDDMFSSSRYS